jgi:hypothetical protein
VGRNRGSVTEELRISRSQSGVAQQSSAQPSSRSPGGSEYGEAMPKSTSPSTRWYLQVEQFPCRQPWRRPIPWRSAAASTVSPSATVKLRPSGVSRTA